MGPINPNPPNVPPMDSDAEKSKKVSQSVTDSTSTQATQKTKSKLDWAQPEVPSQVLSEIFKNVLHAAICSKIIG